MTHSTMPPGLLYGPETNETPHTPPPAPDAQSGARWRTNYDRDTWSLWARKQDGGHLLGRVIERSDRYYIGLGQELLSHNEYTSLYAAQRAVRKALRETPQESV